MRIIVDRNRQSWHKNGISSLVLAVIACLSSTQGLARELDLVMEELESIREQINDRVRQRIEDRVEQGVSTKVEETVEETVTTAVDETVSNRVANMPLPTRPDDLITEDRFEVDPQARLKEEDLLASQIERQLESRVLEIEQAINLAIDTISDQKGRVALSDQWLVMADAEGLELLTTEGYEILSVEELSGLGFMLGRIKAPASFDPSQLQLAQVQVLESADLTIDLNHVYLPQRDSNSKVVHYGPKVPKLSSSASTVIGMIDSSINQAHPVFKDAVIGESVFTPEGFRLAEGHGTAIASILVGQSDEFNGLSPRSRLYNGVVFVTDEKGNEFSTTASIVRAINWLIEQETTIINMSLAGPDNAILRAAVQSACNKGVIIVSAVGNAGPASPPLYPSAYDCTIAVTGVDDAGNPYHRANRGDHVDFALPGVDVEHADAAGGYATSSGTSYAAAILSGMIANRLSQQSDSVEVIRAQLTDIAEDLGMTGADPVFGNGLLRPRAALQNR